MDAHSKDLRKKIVEAVEQCRMGKSEAARAFGVSLSSVKPYVKAVRGGRSRTPGKAPSKRPKLSENAKRLWEADVQRVSVKVTHIASCNMRGLDEGLV